MDVIAILEEIVKVRQRMLNRGLKLAQGEAIAPAELDGLKLNLLAAQLELAREREERPVTKESDG